MKNLELTAVLSLCCLISISLGTANAAVMDDTRSMNIVNHQQPQTIGLIASAADDDDDGSNCELLDPDAPPPPPGSESGGSICNEVPEE